MAGGGFHLASWGVAALALAALLAGAVAVTQPRSEWRLAHAAVGAWLLLAAWQGLSALWSDEAWGAVLAMDRTLLYALTLALGGLMATGRRRLRLLIDSSLAATALVAAIGVGARLLPDLVPGDDGARLATPVTYWNGMGALMAFGLVLAVAVAGDPARGRRGRAAAAALVPVLLLALLLTASRGAVAALGVGVLLLLLLGHGRLQTAIAAAGLAAASIPILVLVARDASLSAAAGTLPPHSGAGARAALLLAGTMLACAMIGGRTDRLAAWAWSWTGRRRAVTLGVLIVVVASVPSFSIDDVGGQTGSPSLAAPEPQPTAADRLTGGGGLGRSALWRVAVNQFEASPLVGTGAGDFRFAWLRERTDGSPAENAHSLYLETLGESGLIGLVLLLVVPVCAVVAVGAPIIRRRAGPAVRDQAVAFAGAATIGAHMAVDWDWQLPGVALPAVALLGGALGGVPGRPRARVSRVPAAAAVVACAACAVVVAGPFWSERFVDRAVGHAATGAYGAALASYERADAPFGANPAAAVGRAAALAHLGRTAESEAAFGEAVDRSPRDWSIHTTWALERARLGDIRGARGLLRRARELNPAEFAIFRVAAKVAVSEASRRAAAGDLIGARRATARAARLDPLSAAPWNMRAKILARLGRFAQSDVAFRAAIGRDQDNWSVMADFAAALLRRGERHDVAEARSWIERGLAIRPEDSRLRELARQAR